MHETDPVTKGKVWRWRVNLAGLQKDLETTSTHSYDRDLTNPLGVYLGRTMFIVGDQSDFVDLPNDWEHFTGLFPNSDLFCECCDLFPDFEIHHFIWGFTVLPVTTSCTIIIYYLNLKFNCHIFAVYHQVYRAWCGALGAW